MAYNKAREEKKWLLWKEAEEKSLRDLGADEDTILELRETDWEQFKSERRYQEHNQTIEAHIGRLATDEAVPFVHSVHELLDDIENEELHRVLLSVDKLTLQIAIWKMAGYSSAEISKQSGLSVSAINFRIWHLRKKMKNIL